MWPNRQREILEQLKRGSWAHWAMVRSSQEKPCSQLGYWSTCKMSKQHLDVKFLLCSSDWQLAEASVLQGEHQQAHSKFKVPRGHQPSALLLLSLPKAWSHPTTWWLSSQADAEPSYHHIWGPPPCPQPKSPQITPAQNPKAHLKDKFITKNNLFSLRLNSKRTTQIRFWSVAMENIRL